MKRYLITIGVGLSLLLGVFSALVLFPNGVGARTSHAVTSNRLARASTIQALGLSSALSASRNLGAAVRSQVTRKTTQTRHRGSGLRASQRLYQGTGYRQYRTTSATTGTAYAARYGTLYRTGRYAVRYGTLYRTGRYLRYTGMARTAAARTGHKCPGM
jgi:hypothetical protein